MQKIDDGGGGIILLVMFGTIWLDTKWSCHDAVCIGNEPYVRFGLVYGCVDGYIQKTVTERQRDRETDRGR